VHERPGRQLDGPGLLLQHPLAVVVELRLQALHVVEVLGRLRPRLLQFGTLRADGLGVGVGARFLVAVVVGHPSAAPSSSTISPSTTSGSPPADAPAAPSEPPWPPAG